MAFSASTALVSIESEAAASPARFDQPLVIRDLSTGVSVALEGSALPERGLRGGVRQRTAVSRYPGASRASLQVLGTEDQPLEMTGWWRDVHLRAGGAARELVAQFDALVRSQNLVEVTWGDALTVRGMLDEFVPEWETEAEVRWRARVVVVESEADTVASRPAPTVPTATSMATVLDLLGALADEVALAASLATAAQAVLG